MKTMPVNPLECDAERFISFIEIGEDECWIWTGPTSVGYGWFHTSSGRTVKVHRWSHAYFKEDLKPGEVVCHLCHNKVCVNPFHLYAGTHTDNIQDMIGAKRSFAQKKTHCKHGHEFTPENTIWRYGKWRACRICRLTDYRTYERKLKERKNQEHINGN